MEISTGNIRKYMDIYVRYHHIPYVFPLNFRVSPKRCPFTEWAGPICSFPVSPVGSKDTF